MKPSRKGFLAGALGGASLAAASPAAIAAAQTVSQATLTAGAGSSTLTVTDPGSDFMVDALKSLDLEFVALNPGGSIRGLHESIIHYGKNTQPELISVMHEEIGVAMAHGYARATGKPMMCLIYGVLGLQHAAEAVYNAYADRVPIVMFAGNVSEQSKRFGLPSWYHSATDLAPLLAGSLKWSDQPTDVRYVADSFQRAYRMAATAPMGPVLVTLDDWLQENSISSIRSSLAVPLYHPPVQPVADPNALAEAARLLVAAQNPVIVVDRALASQAGMDNIGELATLLGAPVLNRASRIAMATDHPLNLTGMEGPLVSGADVFLFLGVDDVWGILNSVPDTVSRTPRRVAKPDAKVITIGIDDYAPRGLIQDSMHAIDPDLAITGDPEASVPYLIAALRSAIPASATDRIAQRATAFGKQHAQLRARNRQDAAFGWDASPISLARLVAEVGAVMANENWAAITNSADFWNSWMQKLWSITRWNQFQMNSGAGGLGFTVPSAIGAALGRRREGIIPVALATDGDLMYVAGSLWTAAHHRVPLMTVLHNNRSYNAEHMNVQRIANRRQRGVDNTDLGTTIADPPVDYAMLARSMGVQGIGPVTDPATLRPALERALATVKRGEPVLVDVVTQPE